MGKIIKSHEYTHSDRIAYFGIFSKKKLLKKKLEFVTFGA